MVIDDIPLLGMIRGRLGYLNQRQQVIAQNVANADTPGFIAKDLKPFSFHMRAHAPQVPAVGQSALPSLGPGAPNILKSAASSSSAGARWTSSSAPDSETTIDGNQVVLEEQMMKMTDARMNYDAAIGFYQKSLQLLRMAARAPGR